EEVPGLLELAAQQLGAERRVEAGHLGFGETGDPLAQLPGTLEVEAELTPGPCLPIGKGFGAQILEQHEAGVAVAGEDARHRHVRPGEQLGGAEEPWTDRAHLGRVGRQNGRPAVRQPDAGVAALRDVAGERQNLLRRPAERREPYRHLSGAGGRLAVWIV